jgi:hypothetical protein
VIDRRRFAADGSEREEQAGETAARATPEAKPESAAEPAARDAKGTRDPDFVLSDTENRKEAPLVEPTLSTLLLSLSTQALHAAGRDPRPLDGRGAARSSGARNLMTSSPFSRRRRAANWMPTSPPFFERILYDLRMRFVEVLPS